MYRRYYSYNDMPTIAGSTASDSVVEAVKSEPNRGVSLNEDSAVSSPKGSEKRTGNGGIDKFLGRFENDDIILLVIVLLLLLDDCDDKLLLAALGFIFLTGI